MQGSGKGWGAASSLRCTQATRPPKRTETIANSFFGGGFLWGCACTMGMEKRLPINHLTSAMRSLVLGPWSLIDIGQACWHVDECSRRNIKRKDQQSHFTTFSSDTIFLLLCHLFCDLCTFHCFNGGLLCLRRRQHAGSSKADASVIPYSIYGQSVSYGQREPKH